MTLATSTKALRTAPWTPLRVCASAHYVALAVLLTPVASTEPARAQDASSQVRFARFPAVSPDGRTLAFSWRGDIWTAPIDGGAATRLTAHQAYDAWPVFSSDGRRIAFASNRDGNDDVFVTTTDGGTPQRLTWHSGADQPTDWADNDQALLLQSRRQQVYGREAQTYKVPLTGGLEEHVMQAMGGEATASPDGRYVVFTRGSVEWWRQRYRGSANTDLWLLDTRNRQFRQLTAHPGNDSRPRFAGDGRTLVYRSDESGAFNVWTMNVETGAKAQLTRYRDEGIRFPNAAKNAPVAVFEYRDRLWRVPLTGGAPQEIVLRASNDDLGNNLDRRTLSRDAGDFALSPDGRQAAIVVRGELFVYDVAESGESQNAGDANRVTETPQREKDPRWSPDGRWLYFVSDREGQEDVYRLRSADSADTRLSRAVRTVTERLTRDPLPETRPTPSPDGRTVAFVRGNGDLWLMDANGTNPRRLVPGWDAGISFAWSPDSRWMAYSQDDEDFNAEVCIIPADGSRPAVNVSQHPDNDVGPAWSPDGRFLVFASRRQGDEFDIWRVYLRAADFEMSEEAMRESLEGAGGARRAPRDTAARRDSVPLVQIDFERIEGRARRMTTLQGDETSPWIAPDGRTYLFTANNAGGRDLWMMKWDGTEAKAVTRGGANPQDLVFTRGGGRVFWRTGRGEVQSAALPAGADLKTAAFRARMTIDLAAERMEKYEEAWRTMRHQFHDSTFGGSDFDAVRTRYRTYVPNAFTIEDFNAVVQMVLGELNGSHLGIGAPAPDTPPPGTGALGVMWDEGFGGPGARVQRIIPRGPASRAESRLRPGDVVLTVDGDSLTPTTNVWALLLDKVSRRVLLTVRSEAVAPARGAPAATAVPAVRDVVIRPVSNGDETTLLYDEWVARRRAIVDSLSGGRLAYLHIRGMSQPSLEQFERELYSAAHGKQGLLIDVRWNGGGSTADLLLAILNVRRHAYTIPRGAPATSRGYPQDRLVLSSWTGPKGLLCNQFSFSNAEIFCHAWRTLEMGPIVGVPTFGAVISTGATTLIDGSSLRLPFRSWYTMAGVSMELHGASPTIEVLESPDTEEAGADPQLVRLVQEMMRNDR